MELLLEAFHALEGSWLEVAAGVEEREGTYGLLDGALSTDVACVLRLQHLDQIGGQALVPATLDMNSFL